MARLIYSAITSLDGYVADSDGGFAWAVPDEEVHSFVNDLERPIGTYLYGRRMYEVMVGWESMEVGAGDAGAGEMGAGEAGAGRARLLRDYAAIWRAADKIVYSTTLAAAGSARTRIERRFEPGEIRRWKTAAARDISVGGPELAAQAFRAGLIDECHLFLNPVVVGGGTRSLPDDVPLRLELLDERRFGNGVVHLHYRTVAAGAPAALRGIAGETVSDVRALALPAPRRATPDQGGGHFS